MQTNDTDLLLPVFCLTLTQCWRTEHALWLLEKIFFTNTPPLTIKDHSEMSFSPTIPLQPSYRRINTTLKLSLTLCLTPNVLPAPGMIHAPALVALTLALFPFLSNRNLLHTHTPLQSRSVTVSWHSEFAALSLTTSDPWCPPLTIARQIGCQVGLPPRSKFLFEH